MTRFSTVLLLAVGATHALKETPEVKKKKELRNRRLQPGPPTCTPCCTDKDGECEVSGCDAFETCLPCSYSGKDDAPEFIDFELCSATGPGGDIWDRKLTAGAPEMRRNLRFGSGGPSVVPADGCCVSTLEDFGCSVGPFNGYPKGENTGEHCAQGCLASCDGKACQPGTYVGDGVCDDGEGNDMTCYANDNGDCDEGDNHGGKRMLTAGAPSFEEYRKSHK